MSSNLKMPQDMMNSMTDLFSVEREGQIIGTVHGFFCGRKYPNTIQLVENIDVQDGDWLIYNLTGKKYYAEKTTPIVDNGEIIDWKVQYLSETEFYRLQNRREPVNIHIDTVTGPAIIGSQQNATLNIGCSLSDIANLIAAKPAEDLPELYRLLAALNEIEAEGKTVEKGRLAKFSEVIQKHSDLFAALGAWAVKLLTVD